MDGSLTAVFETATAPFVGREYELVELRTTLAATLGGRGGVALIAGEPGIGKTRLAGMVVAAAAAAGAAVWSARCWEDGAPAFWPWNAALRRWMDQAGDSAARAAAGPLAGEVARVFAVLRERLPTLPAESEWESEQARFRVFDGIGRFLADVARPAGLVVVLDDVHWADGPSLKLLEFLASDLVEARVLLVATYRDTEVQPGHPFGATLARLAREASVRRVLLAGLSAPDCVRYVGAAGATHHADELGRQLHRETNGNPFLLGELVRLLSSEGRLDAVWDARGLPPGVREVVTQRLAGLGPECRAALAVGALYGDGFAASDLEAVLPPAPSGARALADVLARAVRDRLLMVSGTRYAFAHALIRRVVVDDIEPSRRAATHERIATAMEHAAGGRTDVIAGELVRHFASAGTTEALRKGWVYAVRGAEQALRGFGWEEAARLYALALDLGARCGALDEVREAELRLARAEVLRKAGDVAGARAECRAVSAVSHGLGRHDLLARAALVAAGPVPDFYRLDAEVRAGLEEACRRADAIDDGLRARLLARLAADIIAANEIDQFDRAAVLGDDAAVAARRAGDAGALARALFAGFYLAALGTRPRTSGGQVIVPPTLPSLQELLDAAEAAHDLEFAAELRHTRTVAMFALGEADAYRAEHDALAHVASSSRVPEALWLADAIAAMRATVEGRFAEGRRLADQALATGVRMQLPNAAGVHLGQQIMWHAVQGRLAELLPALDDFVERHPRVAMWRSFRALARLAHGDVIGARAEFRGLIGEGLTPAKRGVNLRSYLAGLGALCVGLRDREHAPRLYELVARRPEPWAVDGCMTLGPWALALGSLARLCGRPTDAAAHFEHAIALGQRMRSRPVVAQAQSLLVAVRVADGCDGAARAAALATLAEAEQVARELALVDVLARVERLRAKLPRLAATAGNVLRCEGDVWMVRFGGTGVRVKDAKGLHYLAALLAAPGREVHVLQLAGGGRAAAAMAGELGVSIDDAPDVRARSAYGARVTEVREALDEAERFGDLGRVEQLRRELDMLLTELAARFRSRARVSGPAENARKAVTKALRTQIANLLAKHPTLGRHLRHTVRMGTVCVYAPPTRVDWET